MIHQWKTSYTHEPRNVLCPTFSPSECPRLLSIFTNDKVSAFWLGFNGFKSWRKVLDECLSIFGVECTFDLQNKSNFGRGTGCGHFRCSWVNEGENRIVWINANQPLLILAEEGMCWTTWMLEYLDIMLGFHHVNRERLCCS